MKQTKLAILGGGMVAGYAAKQMVELGLKAGELTIFSAETALPYERPPLSKSFLVGKDTEESIRINTGDFYREHGIEMQLGCEVSSVDARGKKLILKSGGEFGFEKLIIATGAVARRLAIPGANLDRVHYLRSIPDSKAIQASAAAAKSAAVIGGGFIGMEVAAVLAQRKLTVTMILSDDRIWKRFFTPEMSAFFESYYTARGVRFVKSAKLAGFRGKRAVESVELGNGTSIACDMAVAGIGAIPALEALADSGLEMDNGVKVNEFLESSQADIYAAGDIANYPDSIFGKRRRVEHWDNAVSQGQHGARVLMGQRTPFRHVPYFFSDVFELSYEYWGDASGADEIVYRGDVSSGSFSTWWLREERLVAAFAMNRPDDEREAAPKWIEERRMLPHRQLKDASLPI